MMKKMLEKFRGNGLLAVLYALLAETILLILLSFAGLFTLETILPGLISSRFVIGKLIITAVLLVFGSAFLGQTLGVSFPLTLSRPLRILFIVGFLWTLGIFVISLLSFPLWSIPIYLISFVSIGYFIFKEFNK